MTELETLRFLIFDTDSPQSFTDDQLQTLLNLNNDSMYFAAASAMDILAARSEASTATSVTMGRYSESRKGGVIDYQTAADRFRELELNTPAFEVAQEAFTDIGQLELIRNYVLTNAA